MLGALRQLNRLECVGETLRQALNAIATVAPEWLRALAPVEWFDRYARRIEDARLPTKPEERQQDAELIGADGMYLLEAVYAGDAPGVLRELEAVQILRRAWVHGTVPSLRLVGCVQADGWGWGILRIPPMEVAVNGLKLGRVS